MKPNQTNPKHEAKSMLKADEHQKAVEEKDKI